MGELVNIPRSLQKKREILLKPHDLLIVLPILHCSSLKNIFEKIQSSFKFT